MEPQGQGIRTWQWVVTVIVIIALIVLGYYMFKGNNATAPTTVDENGDMVEETSGANRVVVSDQFPGNIVYLSSVQLENPGFVVIKKDNNGVPGSIIGSQYFDKGINPGRVTLTSSTVEGGVYYATLYSDDGDRIFNATKDMPIKDSAGKEIMRIFRASATVTEVKG